MQESTTQPLEPGSPEWVRVISASKIPVILGLSRFKSQWVLWHEMKGTLEHDQMDERRAAWGHIAEQSIAEMWAYDHPGWELNGPQFETGGYEITYTDDSLPFPNQATLDRVATCDGVQHIIECKTAARLDDWGRPGQPNSVPADYYAQVIWQMGTSGIRQATIAVLAHGDGPEYHEIEWDQDMYDGLVDAATEWWQSLQDGKEPALDGSTTTYKAVRGIHPEIDRGKDVKITLREARDFLNAIHAEKAAQEEANLHRSRMIQRMGTAKRAMLDGIKIADRRATKGNPALYPNTKAQL